MPDYQKYLPKHLVAEEHLYTCIRSIYRSILLCEMLFQRTKAYENAKSFGQKLISATANQEMRTNRDKKAGTRFHALQSSQNSGTVK